jgi:hypothetical protein
MVIDRMLHILGPNGERWTRGIHTDEERNHCILGALRRARHELKIKGDKSAMHIRHAIAALSPPPTYWHGTFTIPDFNDCMSRKFSEIAMVLAYARAMAAGEKPEVMRVTGNALYIALDA